MQAFKFLLLITAYASGVTAKFTWRFRDAASFGTTDLYSAAVDTMDQATTFYNYWVDYVHQSTPDIQVTLVWNKAEPKISFVREQQAIYLGPNKTFYNKYWAIHMLSHVLGVGRQANWNCSDQMLMGFPKATALYQKLDNTGKRLGCDDLNFKPYGLNHAWEFTDQKADRHVQLVSAMLIDGLRKNFPAESTTGNDKPVVPGKRKRRLDT